MEEYPQENEEEKIPERPLECNECKKDIAVRYIEIEKGNMHKTSMCNDCPELQKKLLGKALSGTSDKEALLTGLACGDCGTTLEMVRTGHPLGCSHCYEIFSDSIVYELYAVGKIPLNLNIESKNETLHIGRAPGEIVEMNSSLQLIALNEALKETIKTEDYEQAAMLRDRINELTEKTLSESESGESGEPDDKK